MPARVAVLHHAVVLDEGQHAVLAGVEGLEAVEQVAVGLEDVDVVLGGVAHGHVAQHEAVGAVGADADVLRRRSIGPPLPDATRPASTTTSSALTPEPSICRLQRMHGPRFGMPWRSSSGGWRRSLPGPSARPMTAIRFWSLGQWNWYA